MAAVPGRQQSPPIAQLLNDLRERARERFGQRGECWHRMFACPRNPTAAGDSAACGWLAALQAPSPRPCGCAHTGEACCSELLGSNSPSQLALLPRHGEGAELAAGTEFTERASDWVRLANAQGGSWAQGGASL